MARTERSEFTATTSASPSRRASCRYRTCPGWSRSNTPFVNTTSLPMWRRCSTKATASAVDRTFLRVCRSRLVFLQLDAGCEPPDMFWPVDADFLAAGLHTERVQEAMIVVRISVALVHGDVELVSPFDEVERVDGKRHLAFAADLFGGEILEM